MRPLARMLGYVPKAPHNDATITLFVVMVATGIGYLAIGYIHAFGQPWAEGAALIGALCYAVMEAIYNAHNVYAYEDRCHFAAKESNAWVWRPGEWIGAFLIAAVLFGGLLYGLGVFATFPDSLAWLADITVAALVASSVAKIRIMPAQDRSRMRYNRLLLALCLIATLITFLMFSFEIFGLFGRNPVPWDYMTVYFVLILGYATHNGVLAILCPSCKQQSPGHLAAIAVGLFFVILFVLWALTIIPVLPPLFVAFFIGTMLILWVSVDLRYFIIARVNGKKKE